MGAGGEGGEGEGAQIGPYYPSSKAYFGAYQGSIPPAPSPQAPMIQAMLAKRLPQCLPFFQVPDEYLMDHAEGLNAAMWQVPDMAGQPQTTRWLLDARCLLQRNMTLHDHGMASRKSFVFLFGL